MNWNELSKEFPINEQYIWLNSGGVSTPPRQVLEHVNEAMHEYAHYGYFTRKYEYEEIKKGIKSILAKFLSCSLDEIALIHNTAEGMNFLAHGLGLQPDDEIILLDKEYPSNVYPWLSLAKKGIKVKFVSLGEGDPKFLKELEALFSENTSLVNLSGVHWLTGIPVPLREVGDLCRKNGIAFAVDLAQGLGHVPIDPKEMNISFGCGSAWKWLLGPVGLGYLYISEDFLEKVEPVFQGADSVINSAEYLPYQTQLKPGADRFSYSSMSFLNWVHFYYSLRFLEKITLNRLLERIYDLADLLRKKLTAHGFDLFKVGSDPSYRSGMVVIKDKLNDTKTLFAQLEERKIICALRDGHIRFSAHLMNTEEQVKYTADMVARLAG